MEMTFYLEAGIDENGNNAYFAWKDRDEPAGRYGVGSTRVLAIKDLCEKLSGFIPWDTSLPDLYRNHSQTEIPF